MSKTLIFSCWKFVSLKKLLFSTSTLGCPCNIIHNELGLHAKAAKGKWPGNHGLHHLVKDHIAWYYTLHVTKVDMDCEIKKGSGMQIFH